MAAVVSHTPLPGSDNQDDGANAFYKMQSEIERVYQSPAGQYIKAELNRLLNTLIEGAGPGERERLQRWIQSRNLNH